MFLFFTKEQASRVLDRGIDPFLSPFIPKFFCLSCSLEPFSLSKPCFIDCAFSPSEQFDSFEDFTDIDLFEL